MEIKGVVSLAEQAEQSVLRVKANYNGQEFTIKLVGENAEKMADSLLGAIKGKSGRNCIT